MKKDIVFSPSIMCSDYGRVAETIKELDKAGADWIHFDIMDGKFVPNIALSHHHIEHLRALTSKLFEAHIMAQDPGWIINAVAEAGADIITIHYESCPDPLAKIRIIKRLGKKAGIALNPSTPVSVLENIVNEIDLILFMGASPGFYGNTFDDNVYEKIEEAKRMIGDRPVKIQVDGGVGAHNIEKLSAVGASVFVLGTRLFMADAGYAETISKFRQLAANGFD